MIKKVLFPIDLHEQAFSQEALRFAVEQAEHKQAELHMLTVLPNLDKPTMLDFTFDEDTQKDIEHSAQQRLATLVSQEVPDTIAVTPVVHKGGTPYEVILNYVHEHHIDLIVIPSHDKSGLAKFFLGSCADKLVRHAHCSVMVYRKSR